MDREPSVERIDQGSGAFFDLVNRRGDRARLSAHGARLVELWVPDRTGRRDDVVLGFDSLDEYVANAGLYFGCTVGRVANRIANARFAIGTSTYDLAADDGRHHLHGGPSHSFDKITWAAEPRLAAAGEGASVVFAHVSGDGEEGYPGRVDARVTYTLTDDAELRIDYRATTDAPTPVSLTNHSYWNLAGAGTASVVDHVLWVAASRYTPTDGDLIPTGSIAPVAGTPVDFRVPTAVGARIDRLASGPGGFDHNLVLDATDGRLRLAARLRDPASGRTMEILTTEPALQLYSADQVSPIGGKRGRVYGRRSGLCLEAQRFPDAVNQPAFPTIILQPGEEYRQTTVHRFSAD